MEKTQQQTIPTPENEQLPVRAAEKQKRKPLGENKLIMALQGKAIRNSLFLFLGLFIFGGYLFFFTSAKIIPTTTKYVFTPIGTVAKFSTTRNVTLVRWCYSPNQKLMEIILSTENNDYDGNDTYQSNCVVTVGDKEYKATLTPIISESNYYVMHVKNVPDQFKTAALQIKIKDNASTDTVKLYTNRNDIAIMDNITAKTKQEYLIEQAQDSIAAYKTTITELQNQNTELQKQIANIQGNNQTLEEEKRYQTEKEIAETNKKIMRNNSEIKKLQESIKTNQSLITENEQKIQKATERIDDLKQ